MKLRSKIVYIAVIAILAVGVWGILIYRNRTTSSEFIGGLALVKEGSLLVDGRFYTNKKTFIPDDDSLFSAETVVGPTTLFHRIAVHVPTEAELKKTNGIFNTDKLPKDESDVDFSVFAKDASSAFSGGLAVGIEVMTDEEALNSAKFNASKIIYRLLIFPKQ